MSEQHFFSDLLKKTSEAYAHSDIKERGLAYSVSATALVRHSPLIVGFNWGADINEKYSPQEKYPEGKVFRDIAYESGSLKRSVAYLESFYPLALTGTQTNFCFFRSQKFPQPI